MSILTTVSEGAFRWVLQASWQAAVLAALVLTVQLIFRKQLSPAWRYGLWLLVLVRLMMPTPPESAISIFNLTKLAHRQSALPAQASAAEPLLLPEPVSAPAASSSRLPNRPPAGIITPASPSPELNAATMAMPAPRHNRIAPSNCFGLGCAVWLGGILVLGLRLVWINVLFRSRLGRMMPVSDEKTVQLAKECAAVLGVRQQVTVVQTNEVESPAVWGLWRKWLLLPEGVLERFSPNQLRHIFLHEFAHIKRHDLEVNWLTTFLQVLHWFNPVLWLAFSRMRSDRELATDALALAHNRHTNPVDYGETILKLLEGLVQTPGQPGLVGIVEGKARIKERFRAIAQAGTARPWHWAAAGLALVIAAVGLTSARQLRSSVEKGNQRNFAVRVADYDTGAPLSGATVTITLDYFGGKSIERVVPTDKDGRAQIQYAESTLKRLAYEAHKTNYLTLNGEWFDQQLTGLGKEFQIKLSQGVEIGGTVTDEQGNPVAGAKVSFDQPMKMLLSGADHSEMWSAPSGKLLAVTDASGHWAANCIWPGISWASLRVHHPDFADTMGSTEITSAMAAEGKGLQISFDDLKQHRLRLTLTKGISISGRVADETGKALPGIQVRCATLLVSPHSRDQLLGWQSVTSDVSGNFLFPHMPRQHLYFLVQRAGYAPAEAELDPAASNSEVALHLVKGRKLLGEVVDGRGKPVSGAQVAFADFSVWRSVDWKAATDGKGRFVWDDAPAGKLQLHIQKDGFITANKIVEAGNKPVSIRLSRTLHITGKVLDAETKDAIRHFQVDQLSQGYPSDIERGGSSFATVEGSNGVYSIDAGRLWVEPWADRYPHEFAFRVRAEGYKTAISREFSTRSNDFGGISYDVELKPVLQISGTVLDSKGQPVAGAQVALKLPASRLLLPGKPSLSSSVADSIQITDAQGRFRVNTDTAAQGLIAVADAGFAEIGTNEFAANLPIKLQPWGRISGTVWEYNNPVTNQEIWASSANMAWPETLRTEFRTNSDTQGQFAFDYVPPGKFRIYRMIPMGRGASSGPAKVVEVRPGTTTTVKFGGEGRPVIGRFKITNPYVAIDWQKLDYQPRASSIAPAPPQNIKREEYGKWREQPDIQQAFDNLRNYPIRVAADGSFHIDEVVPGKYEIRIQIIDPREPDAFAYSKFIVNTTKTFEVPEPPAGLDDAVPLDIGTFEIVLKPDIKLGQTPAPDFTATNIADGKQFKLADFRGKYVLLDFWATWCAPCIGDLPYLKQLQEKFKDRSDFVIIGLSVDKTIKEPGDFLTKNQLPWIQGYIGDLSGNKVAGQFGVQGIPAVFLINPDDKIVESDLTGSSMIGRLEKYLK